MIFIKRGISLIVLITTVSILVILVSTITISGVNSSNNTKKMAFGTEIKMIQDAVNTYKTNNVEYPVLQTIVLDISQISGSNTQFSRETNVNNKVTLYQIDLDKININSLGYGGGTNGDNDMYVLSKDTGNVYYAKGLKIGNTTYFSLTDDILRLIEYKSQQYNISTNKPILFVPSAIQYTREKINLNVKVPLDYLVSSISSNNSDITLNPVKDTNYSTYSFDVLQNSVIKVKYQKSADLPLIEASYNVNNIDTIAPVLTNISNDFLNKTVVTNSNGEKVTYVKLTGKSDDLSGINNLKYETYEVKNDIQDYFENNGTTIKNDTIIIPEGIKNITVFIKDNAGNWNAYYSSI